MIDIYCKENENEIIWSDQERGLQGRLTEVGTDEVKLCMIRKTGELFIADGTTKTFKKIKFNEGKKYAELIQMRADCLVAGVEQNYSRFQDKLKRLDDFAGTQDYKFVELRVKITKEIMRV